MPAAKDPPPRRLIDRIRELPAGAGRSKFRWLEILPAALREQVIEVKTLWRDGTLKETPNALALKIVAALEEAGVNPPPGRTTVYDWLKS